VMLGLITYGMIADAVVGLDIGFISAVCIHSVYRLCGLIIVIVCVYNFVK
jgi:hypothetical protein